MRTCNHKYKKYPIYKLANKLTMNNIRSDVKSGVRFTSVALTWALANVGRCSGLKSMPGRREVVVTPKCPCLKMARIYVAAITKFQARLAIRGERIFETELV
jgi:hypothetical protein